MESDYAGLGHLVARDRGLDWRKKLQVLAYLTTFGICLQCYNRGVSRVIRAFRRWAWCGGGGPRSGMGARPAARGRGAQVLAIDPRSPHHAWHHCL